MFEVEAGIRLTLEPFEARLLGRFEQIDARFRGVTDLQNSIQQFENVILRDRRFGGLVTLGVAF